MVEVDSKCPRCGEGTMKLQPNPQQLFPDIMPPGLAKCSNPECAFEDRAMVAGKT
jgi:hypothetical protein